MGNSKKFMNAPECFEFLRPWHARDNSDDAPISMGPPFQLLVRWNVPALGPLP